jgi:predicted esterase
MRFAWLLWLVFLTGCATPAQQFRAQAATLGWIEMDVHTDQFEHRLFYNGKTGKQWHVYLDGDGTPWIRQRWIAEDPTARNPLILELMSKDPFPAILLGRPCYYGLQTSPHCQSKYWTSHRYSREVVNSIVAVLQQCIAQYQIEHLVLIGYSGGGAIAALVAGHISSLDTLVTLAANLNVKAWSEFHAYPTLSDSLDPVEDALINQKTRQLHFAGADDTNVPSFVIESFVKTQKKAEFHELEHIDHAGWKRVWDDILKTIAEE